MEDIIHNSNNGRGEIYFSVAIWKQLVLFWLFWFITWNEGREELLVFETTVSSIKIVGTSSTELVSSSVAFAYNLGVQILPFKEKGIAA